MLNAELNVPQMGINKTVRIASAVGVAALVGGSAVVAYFDPMTTHFFPLCPMFAVTGFACSGCGLTRAFHALFHGDVVNALHFNLLMPLWALIFAYLGLSLTMTAIRGKGLPMWPADPRFLVGFMIALLVFGVLRNIPVYPLNLFFP